MARTFNGTSSDFLDVGDQTAIDISGTALTIACWAKIASLASRSVVVSKQGASGQFQYELRVNATSGLLTFVIDDGTSTFNNTTGATAISTGTWTHLAGVKNGTGAGAIAVYVGGASDGSATSNQSIAATSSPLYIGSGRSSGGSPANVTNGDLAEVAIWNVALTAAELAALAKGVSPLLIRPQSLQGYWPLIGRASPETDLRNGNGATVNGTAAAAHPRVYWPSRALDGRRSGLAIALSLSKASTSSTPDTVALPAARGLSVASTSASASNDAAVLAVARALAASAASASSTPDTVALRRALVAALSAASTSSTPDTAAIISLVAFALSKSSASTTPDTAAIPVARALGLSATSAATTNDVAVLLRAMAYARAVASVSSTNDAVVLIRTFALSLSKSSVSATPDTAALLNLAPLALSLSSASTTPDTAVLLRAIALTLAVASRSKTLDLPAAWARHTFAAQADELSSAARRTYPFVAAAEDLTSRARRTYPFRVVAETVTSEA